MLPNTSSMSATSDDTTGGSPRLMGMPSTFAPTLLPQFNMADALMQWQRHMQHAEMLRRLQHLRAVEHQPTPPRVDRKPKPCAKSVSVTSPPIVHHNTPLAHQMAYAAGTNPDEPKPAHSYIGLIAMAILGTPDKKMVLSDIYQWILDNYLYFRHRGPGWRNSIRHNLSLNDCFVKAGRSANGKGHYWAIHPANVDDFSKGDYRRRRAQRKVRRHMGLAVGDDDSDSDVETTVGMGVTAQATQPPVNQWMAPLHAQMLFAQAQHLASMQAEGAAQTTKMTTTNGKRSFSVANLLAKDEVEEEEETDCKPRIDDEKETPKLGIDRVTQSLWLNRMAKPSPSIGSQWPVWPTTGPSTHNTPLVTSSTPHDGSLDLSPKSSSNTDNSASSPNKREEVIDTAKQWEATFAKIMARSLHARQQQVGKP